MRPQPAIRKTTSYALTAIVAVGVAAQAASAQIDFEPPVMYAVDIFPTSVTSADLDGDGDIDLAVTNVDAHTLTILFNDGAGTFSASVTFPAPLGSGPFALAAGDLDADEDNDLAVVLKDANSVLLYLNDGNGIFTADATLPVGDTPRSIAVGNLNQDLQPDIAVANRDSNDVSVLLNQGGGAFGPRTDYPAGSDLRQLVMGLLNDDDHPDIAVSSHNTLSVALLLNTGDGGFAPVSHVLLGGVENPEALAIGDLDDDGAPDLAVGLAAETSGSIRILENTGDAVFILGAILPASADVAAIQVGDLNADGMQDLAAADRIGDTISTYENLGAGDYGTRTTIAVAPNPYYMRVGDFTGNGLCDDIAVPNSATNQVTVLISQAVPPCPADMSGDGIVDAADLAELLGAWGPNPGHPADFDGDGMIDAADLAQLLGAWGACP